MAVESEGLSSAPPKPSPLNGPVDEVLPGMQQGLGDQNLPRPSVPPVIGPLAHHPRLEPTPPQEIRKRSEDIGAWQPPVKDKAINGRTPERRKRATSFVYTQHDGSDRQESLGPLRTKLENATGMEIKFDFPSNFITDHLRNERVREMES